MMSLLILYFTSQSCILQGPWWIIQGGGRAALVLHRKCLVKVLLNVTHLARHLPIAIEAALKPHFFYIRVTIKMKISIIIIFAKFFETCTHP